MLTLSTLPRYNVVIDNIPQERVRGIDHWANPGRYLPMQPAWVPLPLETVLFTGACEILGALGLLVPRLRRLAGLMLAVHFVAVFPASVHNALRRKLHAGLPKRALL